MEKIVPSGLPFFYNFIGDFYESTSVRDSVGNISQGVPTLKEGGENIQLSVQIAAGRFITPEIKLTASGVTDGDLALIVKAKTEDIESMLPNLKYGNYISFTQQIWKSGSYLDYPDNQQILYQILNYWINGYHVEFRVVPILD